MRLLFFTTIPENFRNSLVFSKIWGIQKGGDNSAF